MLPEGAYTGPRLAAWISSNFATAAYSETTNSLSVAYDGNRLILNDLELWQQFPDAADYPAAPPTSPTKPFSVDHMLGPSFVSGGQQIFEFVKMNSHNEVYLRPALNRELQHKCQHKCLLYSHSCRAKPLNLHSPPGPCYMCYMCYILHAKPLNIHSPPGPCYMCYMCYILHAKPRNLHSPPGPCYMCYMCYILHAKPLNPHSPPAPCYMYYMCYIFCTRENL